MTPKIFFTKDRPKFSHMDPFGIINNENYLSYFMDHRMTALRENLGWDLKTIMRLPIQFVVKKVSIEFLRPLIGDDEYLIKSRVTNVNGSDITVLCEMLNSKEKTNSVCEMVVTAIDPETRKSTDWPKEIINLFYEEVTN